MQAQQVEHPVAGDVRQAAHRDLGAQQLEHRPHVDHGRLEQRVGQAGTAQQVGPRIEVQAGGGDHPAGERVAVGVQPRGRQADQRVARAAVGAGHDCVQGHDPHAGAAQIKPGRGGMAPDQLGDHRQLAARDLDPGVLGAALEPDGDLLERRGVDPLDREVVEHRDRLGAHADDVVDVHRDAVDPDGAQAAGLLGEDELGADAVRRQRDAEVGRDPQHVGVVARREHRARR